MAGNFSGLTARTVPALPQFIFILRIVTIVLALGVLIASAFAVSMFGEWGVYAGAYTGSPGFLIFVSILTWIAVGGTLAVEKFAVQIYFRIAVIILYIFTIIFWLSAWAWAASVAASVLARVCYSFGCYEPSAEAKRYGGGVAAGAALGALNWVLLIVITVFYCRACIADPEGTGVPATTAGGSELGEVKQEQAQAVPPQQQEQYQQYPTQQQYPPQQQQQQAYPTQQGYPQQGYPQQQYQQPQ